MRVGRIVGFLNVIETHYEGTPIIDGHANTISAMKEFGIKRSHLKLFLDEIEAIVSKYSAPCLCYFWLQMPLSTPSVEIFMRWQGGSVSRI